MVEGRATVLIYGFWTIHPGHWRWSAEWLLQRKPYSLEKGCVLWILSNLRLKPGTRRNVECAPHSSRVPPVAPFRPIGRAEVEM
jgi:hypothetical protein